MSRNPRKQFGSWNPAMTRQALQARWTHLQLRPATLLHLQEVLDTSGIGTALVVTEVVVQEKQSKLSASSKEWGWETLRLISLEEARPFLLNLARLMLEALIAWRLVSLSNESLEEASQTLLAVLFLVVILAGMHLSGWYHDRHKKRVSQNASVE